MIKLSFGGGTFQGLRGSTAIEDGWLNVDYPFPWYMNKKSRRNIDVECNFMELGPIPYSDNTVDIIYTEHCIEHLTEIAVAHMFKEAHRILVPGGGFRVSCPDADIAYNMYCDEKLERLGFDRKLLTATKETELIDMLLTPLVGKVTDTDVKKLVVENTKEEFYKKLQNLLGDISKEEQERTPGYHISIWHFNKLESQLHDAGFANVSKSESGASYMKAFRRPYLDRTAPEHSVYVECRK